MFVHSVFRYQSLQGGALTVAADAPVEARECRVESAVCVCVGGGVLIPEVGWLLSRSDSPENRSGP